MAKAFPTDNPLKLWEMPYLPLVLFASLFCSLVPSAFASSFYEQPFPDTVRNAPTIIRGKVGKSESAWTTLPDGSKHLFTYYDVEVSEGLKGRPRAGADTPIRIRELGGSKDGVSMTVSGTAGFEKGEDVIVMLGEANTSVDGAYPVVGMMMGKYNLEKGADGKEYLRGAGIGSAIRPGMRHAANDVKSTAISLESLREMIKTQASEPKSTPSPIESGITEKTGLFTSNGTPVNSAAQNEKLAPVESEPESSGRAKWVFGVGAILGIAWFLNSRRKRR